MTARRVTDLAASVRQRLQNNAKATGRPFQEVLQYFAMERFLYRLSQSPHIERFILKGALMFTAWHAPATRPTMDIDFLARLDNSAETVLPVIREICSLEVEPDGLVFDLDTLRAVLIKEDADYEGLRVTFLVRLQNARVPMQLDLGFGDVLTPAPVLTDYPTILDFAPPRLYGYSRETTVAEKFEAMVKLGQLNSRMKDFFDIWMLLRQFPFDGPTLAAAIAKTFARRQTALELPPHALSESFASDSVKTAQWGAFLRKSRIAPCPGGLPEVITEIASFVLPAAASARDGRPFPAQWKPPGPWKE
jgi:hypothetical protein